MNILIKGRGFSKMVLGAESILGAVESTIDGEDLQVSFTGAGEDYLRVAVNNTHYKAYVVDDNKERVRVTELRALRKEIGDDEFYALMQRNLKKSMAN